MLGGTEVLLNGVTNAPIYYAAGLQVSVQIPYTQAVALVTGSIKVDGASSGFIVNVTNFNPGIFTLDSSGAGAGAILRQDFSLLTSANPAVGGETVMVYATGLGALDPADGTPPAAGSPAPASPLYHTAIKPTVSIDGQPADVPFSGLAPYFVGLYQVNVKLPSNLSPGNHQFVLNIGGVNSNTVVISTR